MKLSKKQKKKLKEIRKYIRRKAQDLFYDVTTSIAINLAKLGEFVSEKMKK